MDSLKKFTAKPQLSMNTEQKKSDGSESSCVDDKTEQAAKICQRGQKGGNALGSKFVHAQIVLALVHIHFAIAKDTAAVTGSLPTS